MSGFSIDFEDEIPDYLSISFSSTDYVGHLFGPSSLEMEDNLLRLDLVLADLFAYIDKQVGLAHTLIVLSADHGGPKAPGYLNALGTLSWHDVFNKDSIAINASDWGTIHLISTVLPKRV